MNNKEIKPNIKQLKKLLEIGQGFEKSNPFEKRKFDPYLNGKWIGNGISYGCYREGQAPGENGPSKDEIFEDLKIISKYWNLIRVYNADDDTENILAVIKENNLPIKMMLGVWLEREVDNPEKKQENIKNVMRSIELANKYQNSIAAISVGNETQVFWSWHKMSNAKLINYIRVVRNNTNVPVTTADDFNFWNKPESQAVANEIDFIVTHIYPLWNGKTLDTAIEWIDSTFLNLQELHPDMPLILGETGWATSYLQEKIGPGEQGSLINGEVSLWAQEKYLRSHNEWVNKNKVTTFLFEAFDEPWKGGGNASAPNEVEKHWGVFYENRSPKESFTNYLLSTKQ